MKPRTWEEKAQLQAAKIAEDESQVPYLLVIEGLTKEKENGKEDRHHL